MSFAPGTKVNLAIANVTIQQETAEGWINILLPNTGSEVWLAEADCTISLVAPTNWPPLDGDIWQAGTIQAWVVSGAAGKLYFVTEANIRNKTDPITTEAALARFGSSLTLVYRKAP